MLSDTPNYLYLFDRARQRTHASLAEFVIAMLPGRTTLLSTTPQRFERLTTRGAVRVESLCGHDAVSVSRALGVASLDEWTERNRNSIVIVDGCDALARAISSHGTPVVAIRSDALDTRPCRDVAHTIEVSIDPWRTGRTPGELDARIEATAERVVDAIIELGSADESAVVAYAAE